jgi:hypothetical protein
MSTVGIANPTTKKPLQKHYKILADIIVFFARCAQNKHI